MKGRVLVQESVVSRMQPVVQICEFERLLLRKCSVLVQRISKCITNIAAEALL